MEELIFATKADGKTMQLPREDASHPFLLREAFMEFGQFAAEFSRKIILLARSHPEQNPSESSQDNLRAARSIFSKWNIEILMLLYSQGAMGFQEIRRSLGLISTAILSQKLNGLQQKEIVQRSVISTRPPRVRYALTEDGLILVKLGEPLFLYLRFHDLTLSRETSSLKDRTHPNPSQPT